MTEQEGPLYPAEQEQSAEHVGSLSLQSDSGELVEVRIKLQLPYPEHSFEQDLGSITQIFKVMSHSSQGLQSLELKQDSLSSTDDELESCSKEAEGMHTEFASPSSPTKPPLLKQGPHVCEVVEQGERLILKQFGARVQFTEFKTELIVEIACFILSALPAASVSCPATSLFNADWLTCMRDTVTEVIADAFEFKES